MERFGKERSSSPLLLAASAPSAEVDTAIYVPPALRWQSVLPFNYSA
jgi:hypothetical protein